MRGRSSRTRAGRCRTSPTAPRTAYRPSSAQVPDRAHLYAHAICIGPHTGHQTASRIPHAGPPWLSGGRLGSHTAMTPRGVVQTAGRKPPRVPHSRASYRRQAVAWAIMARCRGMAHRPWLMIACNKGAARRRNPARRGALCQASPQLCLGLGCPCRDPCSRTQGRLHW